MRLAAGDAQVAMKRRAVNRSTKVRTSMQLGPIVVPVLKLKIHYPDWSFIYIASR
jgi:hypothetical protein